MDNIIIVGSSGHAKAVIDIVEQQGRYCIAGLLDPFRQIGEQTLGCSILGQEADLPELIVSFCLKGILVAIGDNFVRAQVAARIMQLCPDLPFVNAIHPHVSVGKDVSVGAGTVVMAGAVVGPCCSIGQLAILNTLSSLDHDSVMEDFSSLAPRAATGGRCTVGSYAAVGMGAVVIQDIHIGQHTIIGAGSTVLNSVNAFRVAYGTPAREIRERKPGDSYLKARR